MARFVKLLTLIAIVAFGQPNPGAAQGSPLPDRRGVGYENTDFFGSDIRPIYETTIEICENACRADDQCQAITFNETKNACFLKSSVTDHKPFEGARSIRYFDVPQDVLDRGKERAADLSFLPENYLQRATSRLLDLARKEPLQQGYTDKEAIRSGIQYWRDQKNDAEAFFWNLKLQTLSHSPAAWLRLAGLAQALSVSEPKNKGRWYGWAADMAVVAYLHGETPEQQAAALVILATALEKRGDTAATIPTLRLAQSLAPNQQIADRLNRVLGMFGFRIVRHQVDNNAENPRICMTFNENLIELGVDYTPFVRVRTGELPVTAEDRQLCIEGVEHGRHYAFTVRAGLPAASGETMHASVDLDVYVRDRDPQVRFTGSAYVLPKSADASIPLISVNTDMADLKISRIADRALIEALRNDVLGNNLDGYEENSIAQSRGEVVWSGTVDIAPDLNRNVTTALPIGDALAGFKPGIYSLTARVPDQDQQGDEAATQWFIVTDLGLETLSGADGVHLFVRGLSDAGPRAGATARLIAMNNEILAETETDENGYARFSEGLAQGVGGMAPAMISVSDGLDDYAFLDLTRAGFDFSDRGVEGRNPPDPIDVFLSTERGAYRPGETVHATVLARNDRADALLALPLTAVVTRPDGVEFSREFLTGAQAGGYSHNVALAASAQTGTWGMQIYADTEASALTRASFLVEDFVPERIDFEIEMAERAFAIAETPQIFLTASYLYGAPAGDLSIEGEVRLTRTRTIAGFPDYVFGLGDEGFNAAYAGFGGQRTDAAGKAGLNLALPEMTPTTRPTEMLVTARISDGSGRPVERSITRPIAPVSQLIGIKPLFDGGLDQGGLARFEVISVGPDGGRTDMPKIGWTISRVSRDYQWYRLDGRWNWEPIVRRTRIANGEIASQSDAVAMIEAAVDWGEYELKLVSVGGGYSAASYTFSAGWWSASGGTDTPDLLQVGLDREAYGVGDVARLRLDARYDGLALVRVMSTRLIDMQVVKVKRGETVVDLTVGEGWGSGAYVMATLIRPMDMATGRNPSRTIGLAYAPIDPGDRALEARFDMPAEATPRQVMDVALKIAGGTPGQQVFATIAAVDLGILNLTGFKSPDPGEHYFGQHRLGMEIHDLYGRLIDGTIGTRGTLRSGGDSANARGNAPPPTQELLAMFSGTLTMGDDGYVRTGFPLPEFNGTVRLMAVVWSENGVGQAEQDILVRDPIVVTSAMPRFMAPGDESRVLVEIAHATGPEGDVEVSIATTGQLSRGGPDATYQFALARNERRMISVPLVAGQVGTGGIDIRLTTPGGGELTKHLTLDIRNNTPPTSRQHRVKLAGGGAKLALDADIFTDFQPGTGSAILTMGTLARIDAPALLMQLDRYPYGCTEQVTSKALPLLYYGQVSDALGLEDSVDMSAKITTAITTILTRQTSSGAFGLWRAESGDLWLDAYVTDFLSRARTQGYEVPEIAFENALDNLHNELNYAPDFEEAGQDIAYALMVLAREGKASIGDLRYYADVKRQDFATPMALAQLAAGLAYYGDQERADRLFRDAQARINKQAATESGWRWDYGSHVRDTAAVIALASEARSDAIDSIALTERISGLTDGRLSTQDAVWSLLAVHSAFVATMTGQISIDGVELGATPVRRITESELKTGTMIVQNNGSGELDAVLTTIGIPATSMPATSSGYRIERSLFTLEGDALDGTSIPLNTRMVAVLRVTPERDQRGRLMVSDPLPAGFEIDNPHLLRAGDLASIDWLDLDTPTRFTEFRDDRFLAAVDWQGTSSFQLAYIVRAISPGKFLHPAASVEDMYRPNLRARTAEARILVVEK